MYYKNYQKARDAAWKILLHSKITQLPVDVREICKKLHCKLYTYKDGKELIKAFGVEAQICISDGFTVFYKGNPYIFYDSETLETRQRFTIAHEIGHVVLEHKSKRKSIILWRKPIIVNDPNETQANQFAARILAPACVLNALNIQEPTQIATLCNISLQAAQYRAGRIKELRQRGRFLSHPLERELLKQFEPFITSHLECF